MRLVLAAVLLTLAATPASAVALGVQEPTLRVVDSQPFRVRGTGFKAGERVRVVLSVENAADRTRSARANARGSFVVSFGAVGIGRCKAWSIAAVGQRGSRAELALPAPMCSPQ